MNCIKRLMTVVVIFAFIFGCSVPGLDRSQGAGGLTDNPGDVVYASAGLTDITNLGGSISAQYYDSPVNETIDKLIDNSVTTKYLTFHSQGYVQYQLGQKYIVTEYAIASANDFAERDPLNWTLYGSNDGGSWVVLDSRSNQDFPSRFQKKEYQFANQTGYTYYRLNMTNNSGTILQLSEWELFGVVDNGSTPVFSVQIEAENYNWMSGIQTETCVEGGLNIGWIDAGDWVAYSGITLPTAGTYTVEYRVASVAGGGQIRVEQNAGALQLGTINVPSTGGWQNWTSVSHSISFPTAGTQAIGFAFPAGGFNINWIKISSGDDDPPPLPDTTLIGLASGMEMTIQFKNSTGVYANSDIYVCLIGRNAAHAFSYCTPQGQLIPITDGQTSAQWSYRISDINGFQIPAWVESGRLYISMGSPVSMRGIVDGAGNIGVVQPDLNNPADPNQGLYFEWMEFTVGNGGFWGNTTQVDQYGFSYTMEMFNDSVSGYASYRKVGITEKRDSIFGAFENLPQVEFRSLVRRPYRILAPCKGDFRTGRTYGTYMDSYVNEVWNYYVNNHPTISHPLGNFTMSVSGTQMIFRNTATGVNYYIQNKPNNDELFEGSGVLASGNTVELALQAQICAALNRHVATNPGAWTNPAAYYTAAPANFYAKFWHDHSLEGKAYGFCYDDVADQSPLIETHSPRGVVLDIIW